MRYSAGKGFKRFAFFFGFFAFKLLQPDPFAVAESIASHDGKADDNRIEGNVEIRVEDDTIGGEKIKEYSTGNADNNIQKKHQPVLLEDHHHEHYENFRVEPKLMEIVHYQINRKNKGCGEDDDNTPVNRKKAIEILRKAEFYQDAQAKHRCDHAQCQTFIGKVKAVFIYEIKEKMGRSAEKCHGINT
ncbi:hypothetical protein [Chlorobaculum sp. 24CR]|uniref:hypothetical protein n=1 Tax=Chlorobaculum sp. 24CR TaxID=2508878 RepID=UPI001FD647F7|nr:hypothetical protein [Chlorobaculum sp. 24CR]